MRHDLDNLGAEFVLSLDKGQALLKYGLHSRQRCKHIQGSGIIGHYILREDEIKGCEVLAINGKRVKCQSVTDLLEGDRILRVGGHRIGRW